jgi:hypothetical protein
VNQPPPTIVTFMIFFLSEALSLVLFDPGKCLKLDSFYTLDLVLRIGIFIMVNSHLIFKLVLNENLGGILGGTQCEMGDSLMFSEC